jgi:hypothetical protein
VCMHVCMFVCEQAGCNCSAIPDRCC